MANFAEDLRAVLRVLAEVRDGDFYRLYVAGGAVVQEPGQASGTWVRLAGRLAVMPMLGVLSFSGAPRPAR
jgi:hypothetical protein